MRTLLLATTGCFLLAGQSAAQRACTSVGTNRWAVKTMAPITSSNPRTFDAQSFAHIPLPRGIDKKGVKKLDARYTAPVGGNLHEGDLVRVTGWVQFIKTSADDCDYHIQLTPTQDGRTGTIIVEIPEPDAQHVADPALRPQLAAARESLRQQLQLKGDPRKRGIRLDGRAYMEFTGALFFDGNDYPECDRQGHGTPAVTCWEVHPVVASRILSKPGP